MSRTTRANLIAGTFLALLVAAAAVLGIQGLSDAVYNAGYAIGSFARTG
jgi:hypothetical protein